MWRDSSRPFWLLLALGVFLSASTVFFVSQQRLVGAAESVRYTLASQQMMGRVLTLLLNAETGQQGFLLTADPRYLQPYHQARFSIGSQIDGLLAEFADNPPQLALTQRLQQLSRDKLDELDAGIQAHTRGGLAASLPLVKEDRGRRIMDEIRSVVGELESEEGQQLQARRVAYLGTERLADVMFVVFITTALSILGALYWFMGRELAERKRAAAEHAAYNAKLDHSLRTLERERNEIANLNEAGNFLQSCDSFDDVGLLVGPFLQALFPEHSGVLYIYPASRDRLVPLATWGQSSETEFYTGECWALRRGQAHQHMPGASAPPCQHLSAHGGDESLCLPVVAQGEALGVLSLYRAPQRSVTATPEETRRLGLMVARQLAATLANLNLRQTLKEQSVRDPLTNAFNRRYFDIVGEKELALARRGDRPLAVVMLDVDHFKSFNDVRGHAAGDAALVAISNYLQDAIREGDWLFRHGGEEFVVLLCDVGHAEAIAKARELCAGVAALTVTFGSQDLPRVTVSMGIACFPEHADTLADLLERADEALYASKESGRNRVTLAGRRAA